MRCPVICLPPVSGTADIFFKQALALSAKGVRVISAEAPVYWNVREWCEGFKKLLDYLELDKVHIFGSSLGKVINTKCLGTYLMSVFSRWISCPEICRIYSQLP